MNSHKRQMIFTRHFEYGIAWFIQLQENQKSYAGTDSSKNSTAEVSMVNNYNYVSERIGRMNVSRRL